MMLAAVALVVLLNPIVAAGDPPKAVEVPPRPPNWLDPKDTKAVSNRIHVGGDRDKMAWLVAMGEELYPAFQEILDHEEDYRQGCSWCIFGLLCRMKGDRTRFLNNALALLADKDWRTRESALEFIGSAGSEKEAAPVAVLMLDEHYRVRRAAARVLSQIGGKRELVVFDLIFKNAKVYEKDGKLLLDNFDIEFYEQDRDNLKARLKKQEEEKAKAKPPEKKDEKK
jgi:hypothetical protein